MCDWQMYWSSIYVTCQSLWWPLTSVMIGWLSLSCTSPDFLRNCLLFSSDDVTCSYDYSNYLFEILFIILLPLFIATSYQLKYWCSFKNTLYYQPHCAQRKPLVFSLLRGPFWAFSPHRGDTLHRWGWNLASPPCQISPPCQTGCQTGLITGCIV